MNTIMTTQKPITSVRELKLGAYQIRTQRFNCTNIIHSGKEAVILELTDTSNNTKYGLKVTREEYGDSHDATSEALIHTALRSVPGCTWVSQRTTLTEASDSALLREYPVLRNSVLMPWFTMPTWGEFKFYYANSQINDFDKYTSQKPHNIDTQKLAYALARTLASLEEQNLAHRDISDNNCLLDFDRNEIKLIDFEGLYIGQSAAPKYGSAGSVGYQCHSSYNNTWDKTADRFAGALLLCEMLCLPQLFKTHGYLGDAYFNQQEIDDRDSGCENYTALVHALAAVSPDLESLFKRTWAARKTSDCPSLAEWYQRIAELFPEFKKQAVANSLTPGLIVFVLDHSDSMGIVTPDKKTRHEKMYAAVREISEKMLDGCIKGTKYSPRYHVALFAYGLNHVNILAETNFKPALPIAQKIPAQLDHGIWQIQQFMDYADDSGEFSYENTAQHLKTSTTYMTSTFQAVEALLASHIDQYKDCPPPYVFHITDGSNMDNGDPAAVVERIRGMGTNHGKVLVSNTFIGDPVMKMPADLKQWPGINAHTIFTPDRAEIGTFLRSLSSQIPKSIRAEMLKQNYSFAPDSVLLFPGEDHAMLHLAITVCGATVRVEINIASNAVQVPLN
jgi:hypothetical protein